MMLRMIELWSRFIIWLYGGFKGVADLKDAWFAGSLTLYSGIVVGASSFPVSDKGWALFGGTFAYSVTFLILFANDDLSPLACIVLILLGSLVSLRIATAKTFWTTPDKVRELSGWRR
jgi:hypothetical protein